MNKRRRWKAKARRKSARKYREYLREYSAIPPRGTPGFEFRDAAMLSLWNVVHPDMPLS